MYRFWQVIWRPDADARITGSGGMEIRPELVQDSRECWVTRNNGKIDQVPMGSEAGRAWSRPEDLLVPREAPAFVLCCLVCAE